jgi:acetyl esterase/lipase
VPESPRGSRLPVAAGVSAAPPHGWKKEAGSPETGALKPPPPPARLMGGRALGIVSQEKAVNRRIALSASAVVLVVSLLVASGLAQGQPPASPAGPKASPAPTKTLSDQVIVERDVEYGRAGDRKLVLDVIRPKKPADGLLPVIVWIHGGAWRAGDKSSGIMRLAPYAASGEYFCASVGYRLSGEALWPAQIHDCKAAIRWLRANAEKLGIDPERIGVWGSSAGGHLVSLLGTSGGLEKLEGDCGSPGQSSRVTCVVDFCGPSDFVAIAKAREGAGRDANGPIELLLGGTIDQKHEEALAASPITHVSPDDPPFLMVHGTDDSTVPIDQAERLSVALKKAGVEVTFVKVQGGGHGFGGPEVDARVQTFFAKHLQGKQVEVSGAPIEAK